MNAGGRQSITFRLTLLFAAVSTGVLLALGVLVGRLAERHFEEMDMDLLDGKLALIGHALAQTRNADDRRTLPGRLDSALIGHHGLEVAILGENGRLLYATRETDFPSALRTPNRNPVLWDTVDGRRLRGISDAVPLGTPGDARATVVVSTDMAHHESFIRPFRFALWSGVGLAALVSGLLGWFAVRRGLAPLRAIRARAAEITAARLDQRLSVDSIPAELADVAGTLNEMLARLQASFRRLSDFSSDLAHELRTPVNTLLTQTQVTLSRPRTLDEYKDVLASNAEEFERLSRMIADMLLLAKADNDLIVPHREPVDLAAEVRGVVEFYDALIEEKGIRLSCDGAGAVNGDRLMLRRALSNLLSNAIRHTPVGGRITLRVDATDDSSIGVTVENSGETIPPEHLPRLFDRFYRTDTSRRNFGEGAGLGLAITRSIARAHGGETAVRSAHGITTFELRLPTGR